MAITIHQSPTSPNMTNADLLFSISGNSSQPQYQFVCDIKDSSKTLLQRIKQQPNPSGYGVFNVGQIISQYVSSDTGVWSASPFATSSNAGKSFWVMFGEEYGTSVSSSITLYSGIASNVGQPALSSSFPYYVVDGLVEPNSGYWNFQSGSYYTSSLAPADTDVYSRQSVLSSAPITQSVQDGEYLTLSAFNGNFNSSSIKAQDLFYFQVRVYSSAGSNIQNFGFFNLNSSSYHGGPRTLDSQEWDDVYQNQRDGTKLLHIGVGPQNLSDTGYPLNAGWDYYTVECFAQESAGVDSSTAKYFSYKFTKNSSCDTDGVRFIWKNEFGTWDYYTAKLSVNATTNVERSSYNQSFVDYSTPTQNIPYDISRRGSKQFYNKLTERKNVTTEILTQGIADWLRELFYSTEVYIQEGSNVLPVVISNADVIYKTNQRSQKLFQYTFEYEYANQLRARI
jgi:hypothetical protein